MSVSNEQIRTFKRFGQKEDLLQHEEYIRHIKRLESLIGTVDGRVTSTSASIRQAITVAAAKVVPGAPTSIYDDTAINKRIDSHLIDYANPHEVDFGDLDSVLPRLVEDEVLGVGDGVTLAFTYTVTVCDGLEAILFKTWPTLAWTYGGEAQLCQDNGIGEFIWRGETIGTVTYETGEIDLDFLLPPDAGNILISYGYANANDLLAVYGTDRDWRPRSTAEMSIITGSGTATYLPVFTAGTVIGDSVLNQTVSAIAANVGLSTALNGATISLNTTSSDPLAYTQVALTSHDEMMSISRYSVHRTGSLNGVPYASMTYIYSSGTLFLNFASFNFCDVSTSTLLATISSTGLDFLSIPLRFYASTFYSTVSCTPTADRAVTLPDAAGRLVLESGTAAIADLLIADTTTTFARFAGNTTATKKYLSMTSSTAAWEELTITHAMLSATHTDSTVAACVRGDLITGQGGTPKWTRLALSVPAANVRNVFGVDNGETEPAWKTALDATNPTTIGIGDAAAPGTSLVFAHRDHKHASPATWTATSHNVLSTIHGDSTTAACVRGDLITGQGVSPTWTRLAKGAAGTVLNMGVDESQWGNSITGDWTLAAAIATENRVLTVQGYDTVASNVKEMSATINSTGRFLLNYNGARWMLFDKLPNIFIGNGAGNLTLSGTDNIVIGTASPGAGITSGTGNIGIGYRVFASLTTGSYNTFISHDAYFVTGSSNCAFGYNAGRGGGAGGSGSYNNFFGQESGYAFTSGANNVGMGYRSCKITTGSNNVAIGHQAGAALGAAGSNICIGASAGGSCTGTAADNFFLGTGAGANVAQHSGGIYIGTNAGYSGDADYNVMLGYEAGFYETGGSKLFVDNLRRASEADGRAKALIYGIFAATTAAQHLYLNCNTWLREPLTLWYASSVQDREIARLTQAWVDSTDATRKGRVTLTAYDTAARTLIIGEASGTAPMLGFFGVAAVVRPTALTAALTSITHTAPGTPDYALQDLTDTGGFGFASKDEGNTALSVILNLQTRVNEIETKLVSLGLLT